jgi:hypothetical protein
LSIPFVASFQAADEGDAEALELKKVVAFSLDPFESLDQGLEGLDSDAANLGLREMIRSEFDFSGLGAFLPRVAIGLAAFKLGLQKTDLLF